MAKVGLSTIINGSFINSFIGVASGNSSSSTDLAKALNGGSSQVTISEGLRLGARAFGTAVQNLNSLIGFVSIGEQVLNDLGDLTDRMIEITEKATKASTGKSARQKLVLEFEELATDFQKIIDDAKIGERELLKVGDIKELFITLGLDPEESDSVQELFDKFRIYGSDEQLIDPDKPNSEIFKMPVNAYQGPNKTLTIGDFRTENQLTFDVPSKASVIPGAHVRLVGTDLQVDSSDKINNVEDLLATDPSSGYSIIKSSDNYLGYNPSAYKQLFLVDNVGTVVQQLTNNVLSTADYYSADISTDGLDFIYDTTTDGTDRYVIKGTLPAVGVDPATASYSVLDSDLSSTYTYDSVKISSDGSYVAYHETYSGTDTRLVFKDTATNTRNNTLYNQINRNQFFDFIDTNKLAIGRTSGTNYDLATFDSNNASSVIASNINSISNLVTVEESLTSNSKYYIGFYDSVNDRIDLYKKGDGLTARKSTRGNTINQISLAAEVKGSESVILGITGILQADPSNQLYSLFSDSTQNVVIPTRLGAITQDIGNILDSSSKLMRKPESIRLLHDLKGLREQIDNNLKAIGSAKQFIEDNIELVRSAGFAFLNLSDQIDDESEADAVAQLVRNEIRRSPVKALAQAENLQSIAIAALTADPDESGLN